jgi:hypothetical protein
VFEVRAGTQTLAWDFRTADIEVLDDAVMSLGSTGGAVVPPGTYTVSLEVGEHRQLALARVVPDPRRPTVTSAEWREAYEAALRARAGVVAVHEAVRSIRSIRGQIEALDKRIEEADLGSDSLGGADSLLERLSELEESLIQTRNEASQDPLNFPPRLDNQYAHVYAELAELPGPPTAGSLERLDDLETEWAKQRAILRGLFDVELADLNRRLGRASLPMILPPVRSWDATLP